MSKPVLGIEEIRKMMPHRAPMALVDRVLSIENDEVVAEKLVSANEPFFQGHFPDNPIMPGVLIAEALAQTSGLGVVYLYPEYAGKGVALVGLDKWRFRKPVVPGDVLSLHSRLTRRRGNILIADVKASVMGENVASGQVMAAFIDWEGK